MTWFIICWTTGAVVSWIGVLIYTKSLTGRSWEGYFKYLKENMESPFKEALKWLLYVVAWPIETFAVLYNAFYARYLTRRLIKSFPKLD